MDEIDTKPIEPVQVALSLFGQKGDQRKINTGNEEMEQEKDIEILQRDLANYKVQLDAKDSAYLQLQFKLQHYRKTSEELSTALKNSELEREAATDVLRWARCRITELESKVKDMTDVVSETQKLKEQLSNVESELNATRRELLSVKALSLAELLQTAATIENERAEELLEHVDELNESIFKTKLAVEQAEKEGVAVSKKDAEMKKQLEMVEELENLMLAKSAYIESSRKDLNRANQKLDSSDRAICDDMDDCEQMKADVKGEDAEDSDRELYVEAFETELNRLKLELLNANDEVIHLKHEVEMLTDELEKVKTEMNEIKVRENEAEVEIALLKSELHKGRSEVAAAKAAEARSEFQSLSTKLSSSDKNCELENLKKELEAAMAKIVKLRTRTEQAVSRAEAAEKAKMSLEDQLKKWRDQKHRRKAARAALREESSCGLSPDTCGGHLKTYEPLGKVLNIEL